MNRSYTLFIPDEEIKTAIKEGVDFLEIDLDVRALGIRKTIYLQLKDCVIIDTRTGKRGDIR